MKRNVVAVALLVALAITAGWWLFIMGPRNERIGQLEDQRIAARDRESTLRGQISRLREIADKEVSYLFALGQMEAAIPEDPDVAAFLEEVNFLADRTGVELISLNLAPPTAPAEGQDLYEINVSMSINGQYFEVLGFLYGLEAMERLARVDSVSLTPVPPVTEDESETPPDETATTSTTAPRPRPDITTLDVEIGAVVFTRQPLVVAPADDGGSPPEGEPPGDGESSTPPDEGVGE